MALVVKNPLANAGDIRDLDSIPGSGRSPGEENGTPLQYSCLDRGAWWATVLRVTKSQTRLSDLTQHSTAQVFMFLALEVIIEILFSKAS